MNKLVYKLSDGTITADYEIAKKDSTAKRIYVPVKTAIVDEELRAKRLKKLGYEE